MNAQASWDGAHRGKCRTVTPPCVLSLRGQAPNPLLSTGVAQQWPCDREPLSDKAEAQGQTTGLQTIEFLLLLISDDWKESSPQHMYTKNKLEIHHPL